MWQQLIGIGVGFLCTVVAAALADDENGIETSRRDETTFGPLPRWRETGMPPVDPNQSKHPFAIHLGGAADAPTSGLIESPPEYLPSKGVLFRYSSSAWPTVVKDCVVELTHDPAYDDIAYVIVSNSSQQQSAVNAFTAGGADMSKVVFIQMPTNSIWLRDYGPHFVWQSGALAIVDSHYYPTRPLDNFIPTELADDYFLMPSYDIGLYYSGGNFQPGANRMGFTTTLVLQDNPGFGEPFIGELFNTYQGIDTLHVFPRLPASVDGTGHIDMWFYLVDEDTVIISRFAPGSHPDAIEITDNAADYMENALGYEVFRVPDHNGGGGVHYTYTNAFAVGDRILIPTYGQGDPSHLLNDGLAAQTWQAAAPDKEIIPINCYSIIPAAGAIHCIVMQVPRYLGTSPAVHVTSPDGGELFIADRAYDVTWVATDDSAVVGIDLYCSSDGGITFDEVIATGEEDDGRVQWTVPDTPTGQAVVKVVATDDDDNPVEAVSESVFTITRADTHVYDFSSGAGVDKYGWGYQTSNWSSIDGNRRPFGVGIPLSAGDYAKIAASDATGGDSDNNRYKATTPNYGYETTHMFEFIVGEHPGTILDIEILWEGYGDACLQMEVYVWDAVEENWSNAAGGFGENRYIDNQAANRDAILSGHIQSDFERYINENDMLTILLYGERNGQESFHDYIALTVTTALTGDSDGDGDLDLVDYTAFQSCMTGPGGAGNPGCAVFDADEDADIDLKDFAVFQSGFGGF